MLPSTSPAHPRRWALSRPLRRLPASAPMKLPTPAFPAAVSRQPSSFHGQKPQSFHGQEPQSTAFVSDVSPCWPFRQYAVCFALCKSVKVMSLKAHITGVASRSPCHAMEQASCYFLTIVVQISVAIAGWELPRQLSMAQPCYRLLTMLCHFAMQVLLATVA